MPEFLNIVAGVILAMGFAFTILFSRKFNDNEKQRITPRPENTEASSGR